jgi:uncharacterized protein
MSTRFILQVTGDGLRAYAVSCTSTEGKGFVAGELVKELRRNRIREGLKAEVISELESGAGVREGERVLVAEGRVPERGRDGYVEVMVDVSGKRDYREAQDGSLDFHETNLIKCVESGQEVARVHAPTAGELGRSVLGEAIRPKPGKAAKYKLGAGVKQGSGSPVVVATTSGQPHFSGDVLWVDEVLCIRGDVDFETGNIRFKGTVKIAGSVLDGFEVHAEKDIEVSGTVGACTLKADGDIRVGAGVTGHGKALLEAGGSVRAKYFSEVEVRAGGDVEFTSEVVGSRVLSKGRLVSAKGTVMGGRAVAWLGMEVGSLGSELGVRTEVIFGQDFEVLERLEGIASELASIEEPLEKLGKRLSKFSDRRKFVALSPKERERVKLEFTRFKELKSVKERLQSERVELTQTIRAVAGEARVRVREEVHPDVVIRGAHGSWENREERRGVVDFVEESDGRVVVRHESAVRSSP